MPNRICPECSRSYQDGVDCICEEYSQDVLELVEGGCPNCGCSLTPEQARILLEEEICGGCVEEGDDPEPRPYWQKRSGISWAVWD